MTRKDFYCHCAIAAMQGELASSSFGEAAQALADAANEPGVTIESHIAHNAFDIADAMLEAFNTRWEED